MKTLISIMAHAAAEDVFKRHLPYWTEHEKEGADLLFWSPANAAVKVEGKTCLEIGKAEHDGPHAIMRFRSIIQHMASLDAYQRFIFMEYDSLILGKLPKLDVDFAGNIFRDANEKNEWMGTRFVHPPFLADQNALRKIHHMMSRIPLTADSSMWDRQLGYAIEQTDLTCESWIANGYGFSANTIHPHQHNDLRNAILNGAHAIHGVKSPECLKAIEFAWQTRHHIDSLEEQGYEVKPKVQ